MRIGDTIRKITMARFSRTLSTLVAAGVDIIKALEITGQASRQLGRRAGARRRPQRVREGSSISQPLIENPVFPPMVSQMVRIGEETGELEKMLGKIADFYEDEVDAWIAVAHLDHRADDDDRRRLHGRHDRDLDVPADVQDAQLVKLARRAAGAAAFTFGITFAASPSDRARATIIAWT